MRKALLRSFVLMSLAVILLGLPLVLTPHRIRPSSFAQIEKGMTEMEVEDILGAKAGNYDGYGESWCWGDRVGQGSNSRAWSSKHCTILLSFDEKGRVAGRAIGWSEPVTMWASLLDRFGLRQMYWGSSPTMYKRWVYRN